jgi:hypothetical protein
MRQHHELSVELSGGGQAIDDGASAYSSESLSTQSSSDLNNSHGGARISNHTGPNRLLTRFRASPPSLSGSESSGSSHTSSSFSSDRVPWLDQARNRLVVNARHPFVPSVSLPHHHYRYPSVLEACRVAELSQSSAMAPPAPWPMASAMRGAGVMSWSPAVLPAWDRSVLTSFPEQHWLPYPQQQQYAPLWPRPQLPPSLVYSVPTGANHHAAATSSAMSVPAVCFSPHIIIMSSMFLCSLTLDVVCVCVSSGIIHAPPSCTPMVVPVATRTTATVSCADTTALGPGCIVSIDNIGSDSRTRQSPNLHRPGFPIVRVPLNCPSDSDPLSLCFYSLSYNTFLFFFWFFSFSLIDTSFVSLSRLLHVSSIRYALSLLGCQWVDTVVGRGFLLGMHAALCVTHVLVTFQAFVSRIVGVITQFTGRCRQRHHRVAGRGLGFGMGTSRHSAQVLLAL